MFAVDVCALPATGGGFGLIVAAIVFLAVGALVAYWVRSTSGRLSVIAVVPILMMGFVSVSGATTTCEQALIEPSTTVIVATTTVPTTTSAPTTTSVDPTTTTTLVPASNDLVLNIDTSLVAADSVANDQSMTGSDSVPNNDGYDFELGFMGVVAVQIDWGDGSPIEKVDVAGKFKHRFTEQGRYTIKVSGSLTGFGIESPMMGRLAGVQYLMSVDSFGDLGITDMSFAFFQAVNLVAVPDFLPSSVQNVRGMFYSATSFNGDISGWDINAVTDMAVLFNEALSFNQDLTFWDTSKVTNMSYTFGFASSFNGDIGNWDTGNVTRMDGLFYGATGFDRSLGNWNVSQVEQMISMLDRAGLSRANYEATLVGWASRPVKSAVNLGALGLSVASTTGINARAKLETYRWTILDGAG